MDIKQIHKLFLNSNGISTDTRKIDKNTIFFALKGEHFNGNTYATKAIELGAQYAIVDEGNFKTSEKYILVDNVLETLQHLATFHREYLNIPIIALTGSNGKTTTKELINQVLSKKFKTKATIGNLNNHIGVPLTLLSMDKNTQIGIVEMGANHIKEIDFLCSIAKPDYGYITNIGKAHLEGFGSLEGVLKGKTELFRHLQKHSKMAFVNEEDPKLVKASQKMNVYYFSEHENSDVTIRYMDAAPNVMLTYKDLHIHSNLIGAYNFLNIAAAIAIGDYFKVAPELIKSAIEAYTPANNRSQIIKKDHLTIILDAYNANPSSMEVAIKNFDQLEGYSSKIAFLGDMFELGEEAEKEHQEIARLTAETNIDQIHLIGNHFSQTKYNNEPRIKLYKSFEDLTNSWISIAENKRNILLIKGSRGMQLERILNLLD